MSVTQGIDEWHSLVSKQKGLAGMAENVRQGFRAGGRAPTGYRLQSVSTGAIRDGQPVLKSRLELGNEADMVSRYLKLRTTGAKGAAAARQIGLELSRSTLTGIEWNALTYAGHTVWNVHNEYTPGGYASGSKRRARSDWLIQRDTHPALISEAEAEAILSQPTVSQARRRLPAERHPEDARWCVVAR
jgi:hypothetical protein